MKDTQLFQRASKVARHYAPIEPQASKVIRALLDYCNQRDKEIGDWRSGRAHQALQRENESLRAANRYLSDMLREQAERKSA